MPPQRGAVPPKLNGSPTQWAPLVAANLKWRIGKPIDDDSRSDTITRIVRWADAEEQEQAHRAATTSTHLNGRRYINH
ncbi:hypothetical protein GWI33_011376 [Rhynchophorus ferrugineus]|uniref:Uncharacterized protein n=1 Tax=Rhynchophorus ferrugineus TaxID=354439 RepID=A0A834ICU4_RHYFE|nr:hypothetical protein GWI33_011376 [Rhynchophorus ferrugineus]